MKTPWDNVSRFEEIIAEYTGSKYAVATDSCTNAIFLCLNYFKPDRRYIFQPVEVPKHTYLSVPMMVRHADYGLKFVDKKWYGMYELSPYPIYDSATRFTEGMYKDHDHFQCISFHYKKYIPIGRGGMILTDDKQAVKWLKQARYDGRSSISFNDMTDVSVCGWHMFMTPEQAARGMELFYRLPKQNDNLATWKDYPDVSQFTCFKNGIDLPSE